MELTPTCGGGIVEPSTARVVFRHSPDDILGPIGFASVGLGTPVEINHLLLSSANPPVGWIVISLFVVDGGSNVELVKLRGIGLNNSGSPFSSM